MSRGETLQHARSSATAPLYTTPLGAMYVGKAEDVLVSSEFEQLKGEVNLLFTSPPFPLNRKKRYGNRQGEEYVRWLSDLAPLFKSLLTPDGSIVIELGNAWVPRSPTMSTLTLRALLEFQEKAELHLCQEFICFNPARLPTPAQWVTIERIRVKDAFTRVWWLSPTERPKADNRRVLTEYSSSMKQLLKRGTYNAGERPSEAVIGEESFLNDNGGAIPPNVLLPRALDMLPDLTEVMPIANTRSNDPYQEYCRRTGIRPHPARMPAKLVEFFIQFLTDEGDVVLDPFGGSNTTGDAAERLGRRWVSVEADPDFAAASESRFREV